MPLKKSKQQQVNKVNTFVLLLNKKTNRHHIIERDHLLFNKKDNLKAGTLAKYDGLGVSSDAFEGTVIMSGSKQQCQSNMSLIEKTNNKNVNHDKEPGEAESDASNELFIDEQTEKREDDDNNNSEQSADESTIVINPIVSQQPATVITTTHNVATLPVTISANNHSSSSVSPTTVSSNDTVLKEVNNTSHIINKRKDLPDESTTSTKKKKHSAKVSHSDYEKLKRQNKQLKKELGMYKENWMPRPTASAVNYFIHVGKILSGQSTGHDDDDEEEKGSKLQKILDNLDMTEKELRSLEHDTDITKTCRQLTKHIYSNPRERAKMLVSLMDVDILKCIQDYARLVHPAQSRVTNSTLNNAIGNVFSTEKRKQGGNYTDSDSSDDMEGAMEDDENIDE